MTIRLDERTDTHDVGTYCPACRANLDRHTNTAGTDDGPTAGDITICAHCGTVLIYQAVQLGDPITVQLRFARPDDFLAMTPDELTAVQMALASLPAFGKRQRLQSPSRPQ